MYEILETPIKVYNLNVQDYHTYFVDEDCVLVHNSCFDPKSNSNRVAKLSNGSKAYQQDSGAYEGYLIAKDNAGHGQSAFKLFRPYGNKKAMLMGDLSSCGELIANKHSSNQGKIYEIVRWMTINKQ